MHEPSRLTSYEVTVTVEDGKFSVRDMPLGLFEVLCDAVHDGLLNIFTGWDGALHDLAEALYEIPAEAASHNDCSYTIPLNSSGYTGRWLDSYGHTPETLEVVR